MRELTEDEDVYWVRTDDTGRTTAALVERAFAPDELKDELEAMRSVPGQVRRILSSRITIGAALKASAQRPR